MAASIPEANFSGKTIWKSYQAEKPGRGEEWQTGMVSVNMTWRVRLRRTSCVVAWLWATRRKRQGHGS